jgi:ribonuclease HII
MSRDQPGSSERRPRGPVEVDEGSRGRIRSPSELVAGVDEVGRGPLAGPVVAAAVVLPAGSEVSGAGDSKSISALRRIQLDAEIRRVALAIGIGAASAREIDAQGIAAATALAMRRAVAALGMTPHPRLLVDGLPVSRLGLEHEAIVRGDATVHAIGCASIVAKVCRDGLMRRLHLRYPAYGWARNAGYGTAEHLTALEAFGPSPHHRLTFGRVPDGTEGVEVPPRDG